MSGSARRDRERQELRAAILNAARALAREGGWQAVTMRKVAERIEYSAPALYEYYASKEAILAALAQLGFGLLRDRLRGVQAPTPRERILQMADGYWEFAVEYRELYQAMYGLDGVPVTGESPTEEAGALLALLRDVLAAYRKEPVESSGLEGDVEILWSTLHGVVALHLAGRIGGGPERAQRLMKRAVRSLLDQWRE